MSIINARFDLIDDRGQAVTERSYRGSWLMVYFGFTHCKVVCPRSLGKLSRVLDALPEHLNRKITPLYITVDPNRDSPEVMRQYLSKSYPRFVGLTGSEEQVTAAKEGFKVFSRPKPDPDNPGQYDVPHTAITYLINPDGNYATHWAEIRTEQDIERDLLTRLAND